MYPPPPMAPTPSKALPTTPPPWPGYEVRTPRLWTYLRRTGKTTGPPVLLLHGFCVHGGMWEELRRGLEDHFDVLVPDLRSHGFSETVPGRFDVADLTDDVVALLDTLAIPRAHIVGYSLGGYIALDLAQRYPDRVNHLGLLCTGAHQGSTKRQAELFLLESVFRVVPASFMRHITERNLRGPSVPEELSMVLRWLMARITNAGIIGGAGALRRVDLRAHLDRITHPTLLVTAGRDLALPRPFWEALLSIPDARHHHIEEAGHALIVSHGEELRDRVRAFLLAAP